MTSTAKSGKSRRQTKPQRSNQSKVWLGVTGVGLIAIVAVFFLLRSGSDTGNSSSRFMSIYQFDTSDLHALTFDPANPARLLFGHHGGVMASNDRGRSWGDLVDQQNFDGMNLVFNPQAPSTLYLAGHNVFASSPDGGATWQAVNNDLPGLDLHGFAASPRTPERFYAFVAHQGGLFVSEDGAASWTSLWAGAPAGTHSIIEVGDGTLVIGASDKGILRSEDGGKTWADSQTGIDNSVVFSVKGDLLATKVFAGTSKGLYASADGGRSWAATGLNDAAIVTVGVNPADPSDVMAISRNGELYHSTDGGATWPVEPAS